MVEEKIDTLLTGNVQLDHHPNAIHYQQMLHDNRSCFCSSITKITVIRLVLLGPRPQKNSTHLNHSSLLRFQVNNAILGTAVLSNELSHAPGMRLGGVFARRWGWEVVVRETHYSVQSLGL